MATSLKPFSSFLVFLLVSSLLFITEARPFNAGQTRNIADGGIEISFRGFYMQAIKTGGPSSGGNGHEFTNAQTLGGIKESGPSAGGNGHDFTNAQTFGGIKNAGPSPGGKGHESTNGQTLGGIKDAGPTPGQGH